MAASTHAIELLSKVNIFESNILGGKAYGSKSIRENIAEQNAAYIIPPRSFNSEQRFCDWWVYKERHLVECFFQKVKWLRRIATRYDKLGSSAEFEKRSRFASEIRDKALAWEILYEQYYADTQKQK